MRAMGMGLASLLIDGLDDCSMETGPAADGEVPRVDAAAAAAAALAPVAVARRRFLGRASAFWAGVESRAVVDITTRPGTSARCSRRVERGPSDRLEVGFAWRTANDRVECLCNDGFALIRGRVSLPNNVVKQGRRCVGGGCSVFVGASKMQEQQAVTAGRIDCVLDQMLCSLIAVVRENVVAVFNRRLES